jgi:uncharacterized protein (TIGR02996 family)
MVTCSERDGFEAALNESPTDATLRLIFADWLEERGLDHDAQRERWTGQLLADPYNPTLRRAYAQWLRGQGDHHGAKSHEWIARAVAGEIQDDDLAIYSRKGLVFAGVQVLLNRGYWNRRVAEVFRENQDALVVIVSRLAPTHSGFRYEIGPRSFVVNWKPTSPIIFYRRHLELARRRTGVRRVWVA